MNPNLMKIKNFVRVVNHICEIDPQTDCHFQTGGGKSPHIQLRSCTQFVDSKCHDNRTDIGLLKTF